MSNMTMGQAVDEAAAQHRRAYPGSQVYAADIEVVLSERGVEKYVVEIRAEHFSQPLRYEVGK